MADKSKNTVTPFDSVLQSGETILWQSSARSSLGSTYALRWVGAAFIFAVGFVISFVASDPKRTDTTESLIELTLVVSGVFVLIVIPVLLIVGIGMFVRNWFKSPPVFAVTNYRLLVYSQKRLAQCDLRDIPNIMKFESKGGRGTLNFGTVFPMFTDIANVNTVYQLIQEQQRKLQKRAEMGY